MARTIELILKIITEPARKQLEEIKRKIADLSQMTDPIGTTIIAVMPIAAEM